MGILRRRKSPLTFEATLMVRPDASKFPTLTRDSIMPFGKYKGQTMDDIADNDPAYIVWLAEETDTVICNKLYDEANREV